MLILLNHQKFLIAFVALNACKLQRLLEIARWCVDILEVYIAMTNWTGYFLLPSENVTYIFEAENVMAFVFHWVAQKMCTYGT